MKIIAYIAAAILIFFGVLFIWGAFSPEGQPVWILVGANLYFGVDTDLSVGVAREAAGMLLGGGG